MSAITSRPGPPVATSLPSSPGFVRGDQRIVIQGVSWDLYDQLSEAIGDEQHVRLAYDGKWSRKPE
jgi:hypothetical protein